MLNSIFTPRLAALFSAMSVTASRYKLNSNGARTLPCLTPDSIVNPSDNWPSHRTTPCVPLCKACNIFMTFAGRS